MRMKTWGKVAVYGAVDGSPLDGRTIAARRNVERIGSIACRMAVVH